MRIVKKRYALSKFHALHMAALQLNKLSMSRETSDAMSWFADTDTDAPSTRSSRSMTQCRQFLHDRVQGKKTLFTRRTYVIAPSVGPAATGGPAGKWRLVIMFCGRGWANNSLRYFQSVLFAEW